MTEGHAPRTEGPKEIAAPSLLQQVFLEARQLLTHLLRSYRYDGRKFTYIGKEIPLNRRYRLVPIA